MFKKILYGIGGIFAFLVLLVIIAPTPEPKTIQEEKENIVVENQEVATTTNNATASTDSTESAVDKTIPQTTEIKTVQPKETVSAPVISSNPQYEYYPVSSVVDGDTLKVNINGTIETLRLIGMDTPETVDPRKPVQCFGKEASNKAKELLNGKKVRLETDSTQGELDKYGRRLAYIYRDDGLFYNKYMIEQGYAHEYTYNTPYKYQAEFKAAQKSAQENLRGLWSPDTCNGDTTSSVADSSSAQAGSQTTGKYYTSSHYSAQYYYPEECDGWKSLSTKYLVDFNTLEDLLAKYKRTLSPQCQ